MKRKTSLPRPRALIAVLWFLAVLGWYFLGYLRSLESILGLIGARFPWVRSILGGP